MLSQPQFMTTAIFYEADASLEPLLKLPIGIIGYGNQGRAQALNLKDNGLVVTVGARSNSKSWQTALEDGFKPATIEEVVSSCDILALLLPDEAMPSVYGAFIEPYLSPKSVFVFAHGFAVHHKTIKLPSDADVLLVAPTSPGKLLRSAFVAGSGAPALVAVEQDNSGLAWKRCLAYAKAIGSTRAGAIKTTFAEETITNLFCEQAVLCGGLPALIKASFDTLVAKGYQSEIAYIFCLKEVKLIADLLFAAGIDGMRQAISNTAKYGSAIAGPQIINDQTKANLKLLLDNIETGKFAKQFTEDTAQGSPTVKSLLADEQRSHIAQTGAQLKTSLSF